MVGSGTSRHQRSQYTSTRHRDSPVSDRSLSNFSPSRRRAARELAWPGVFSFALHLLAVGMLILMTMRLVDCAQPGGNGGYDRDGQLGGGVTTVEISVEGPAVQH